MRKTLPAFYLGIFVVFTLMGCGNTPPTGSPPKLKLALPAGTPQQPVGVKAITPTSNGIPAFTKGDVIKYVKTHNMPFNVAPLSDITDVQVSFITSKEVNALLNRQNTHIPDNYLLCFVTLTGKFIFPGPPTVDGKTSSATYQHAFEIFDAKTGNLLMGGGLGAGK
jgi:hypothetical protein